MMKQCKEVTRFYVNGEVKATIRCCLPSAHEGRHVSNVADSKPQASVVWE